MIKLETRNYNMMLTEKQQKYQRYCQVKLTNMNFLHGEEILPFDQSRIIEQAKFTYSPLGKAFEEQTKTIEEQGKEKADAITNENKKLEALTNKDDDHKGKEIFNELVK